MAHNTHYATIELEKLVPRYEHVFRTLKRIRKSYSSDIHGYDEYLRDWIVRGFTAELDAYDRVFALAGVVWNGEEFESL